MKHWHLETYDGTQDLTEFFIEAERRRFYNNSNADMLLKSLENEIDANLFLLYNAERIIGCVVSHKLQGLEILGSPAYRIGARICVLSHLVQGHRLHNTMRNLRNAPRPHDHPSAQFLIPACIEHCGRDANMYISTHPSPIAKQRAVHTRWAPEWRKQGFLEDPIELEYRGTIQSFWKFKVDNYYKEMQDERWPEAEEILPVLT
jgi:hypothetical protein